LSDFEKVEYRVKFNVSFKGKKIKEVEAIKKKKENCTYICTLLWQMIIWFAI